MVIAGALRPDHFKDSDAAFNVVRNPRCCLLPCTSTSTACTPYMVRNPCCCLLLCTSTSTACTPYKTTAPAALTQRANHTDLFSWCAGRGVLSVRSMWPAKAAFSLPCLALSTRTTRYRARACWHGHTACERVGMGYAEQYVVCVHV